MNSDMIMNLVVVGLVVACVVLVFVVKKFKSVDNEGPDQK